MAVGDGLRSFVEGQGGWKFGNKAGVAPVDVDGDVDSLGADLVGDLENERVLDDAGEEDGIERLPPPRAPVSGAIDAPPIERPVISAEEFAAFKKGLGKQVIMPVRTGGLVLPREGEAQAISDERMARGQFEPPVEVVERLLKEVDDKSSRKIAPKVAMLKKDGIYKLKADDKVFCEFKTARMALKIGKAVEVDSGFVYFPAHGIRLVYSKTFDMVRAAKDFKVKNFDIRELEKVPDKYFVSEFKGWDWEKTGEHAMTWLDAKSLWHCTCSGSRTCEHIKVSKAWLKAGRPMNTVDRFNWDAVMAERKKLRHLRSTEVKTVNPVKPADTEKPQQVGSLPSIRVTEDWPDKGIDTELPKKRRVTTEPNRSVKDEWLSVRTDLPGGDEYSYRVSRWVKGSPASVYHVKGVTKNRAFVCDCADGKTAVDGGCVHIEALNAWIDEGQPSGKKYWLEA